MTRTRSIDRRAFLKKTAIVGAGAAGGVSLLGSLGPAAEAAGGSARYGSLCQAQGGQSDQDAVLALESKVGRSLSTTHHRLPWQTSLVNDYTTWSVHTGHTPIISWFARNKSGLISWKGIGEGKQDAWITTQARALKATGWSGYFCFHKEPEDEGNPTDWKAAYHRVHKIFDNVGVTKMKWVVCLMASTFLKGTADLWMPPNYDLLGVDGYNRYSCQHMDWRPFSKIFTPSRTFAQAHGKPLYIIESGCIEGAPGQKAQWFTDARAVMKSWPEIVGISYNNESTDCTYFVTSTASSLASFRAMGQDPYFL